ncbi:tetratricopeptide repeat protein [Streptomyces sp. WAC01526]|uniref:tetratricopeptide repeat protein n=1 Tax=Streptomyces sp. WAC01526 TaxID=2588709 RepID=UPI0021CCA87C|nr:tetratricopeptide repeat protein [Streptomyces sp. WAC01526]
MSISGYHSGDITTVHVHGREPVPWPHQVGVIPREAAAFQDRDEADQLQAAAVTNSGTAVLCQVLRGTGGVGKTQLAARYARQVWVAGELDVLVWADASSRSSIIAAYAQAAEELLAAEPGDPERSAQAFLRWLEPRPPGSAPDCRWLVVLDDVADPGDVSGLWPAKNAHGRTVVTTRRRDVAVPGQRIDLGVFTPTEAAAYLLAFLVEHERYDDPGQIGALARELGYLPLALSQAAAYITDAGIPIDCHECAHRQCPSYRRRLADRTTTLTSMLPEHTALPDDQTTTVAAAWSLSIERADALRPAGLARPMLQLAAMLDPNGIPQDVMTSEPALDYLTEHRTIPEQKQGSHVTEQDARDALRVLHRLNLITHDPDAPHQALHTHQLIQRATRDTLTPDHSHQTAHAAADALLAAWPDIERDTALAQTLRANTAVLTAHSEDALYQPEIHEVLHHTGISLGEAGQVTAATAYLHRLTETATRHLGPHHPDTLTTRHSLAQWRGESGDAAGAAAALEELLVDRVRVLGNDHPDTLTTRHSLAHWRGEAGDSAGAAAAFEELLVDHVRVLGNDHPHTLTTRGTLAYWRYQAGDATGAAAAFEELLVDHVRVLGNDHPDTLTTRGNLAHWRGEAGDSAGAAAAFEELLVDRVRVLGNDHPDTLTTRHSLAHWRGESGDATGAAAALEELLVDRVRVLGNDHPKTLTTRRYLARWRSEAGMGADESTDF